jgi:predicted GH43/DUF377 family glycosyl hydrolase
MEHAVELRSSDRAEVSPMPGSVTRLPLKLEPDPHRVITRLFWPGDIKRVHDIIARSLSFSEEEVETRVEELGRAFRTKHPDLLEVLAEHYEQVKAQVPADATLSEARRIWIGACFTMEYALESVALFNPSIVPALLQQGAPPGGVRFLMSLRATGEGHISSIVFRTGTIDAEGSVEIDPPGSYSRPLKATVPDRFRKVRFERDLAAVGATSGDCRFVLDRLGEEFTIEQLSEAIAEMRQAQQGCGFVEETADLLISLTRVNHQLHLPHAPPIFREVEIVVFPFSDLERHGIEDLRLVQFTDDDGSRVYYGTFSAYDGGRVFPQLLEYNGGEVIDVSLITGAGAKNKGMALFPRRIHGKYAMISRIDNENLYYMESDDVLGWEETKLIQAPKYPWQVIQIGNCGSPIETERGWLLLTHGVGPMRQYCIGASLLDRDDPSRVIGQTREPLLTASDDERWGYVPNVVYTCGAMVHNRMLFIPYAISDLSTSVARVDLDELLESLETS